MLNFKFQYINVVFLVQRSSFTIMQFPIIFEVLGRDDVDKHTQHTIAEKQENFFDN